MRYKYHERLSTSIELLVGRLRSELSREETGGENLNFPPSHDKTIRVLENSGRKAGAPFLSPPNGLARLKAEPQTIDHFSNSVAISGPRFVAAVRKARFWSVPLVSSGRGPDEAGPIVATTFLDLLQAPVDACPSLSVSFSEICSVTLRSEQGQGMEQTTCGHGTLPVPKCHTEPFVVLV